MSSPDAQNVLPPEERKFAPHLFPRRWWLPWRWPRGGMQVLVEGEAENLTRAIRKKVHSGALGNGTGRLEDEAFNDWLFLRFRAPLEIDAVAGPAFGKSAT